MIRYPVTLYESYTRSLEMQGYKRMHTSLTNGYTRVNYFGVDDYCGKFGKGKRVYTNNKASTRYQYVTYWIKEKA